LFEGSETCHGNHGKPWDIADLASFVRTWEHHGKYMEHTWENMGQSWTHYGKCL
jgi:hypothetical protein